MSTPSSSPGRLTARRHSWFYYDDGNITFVVEDLAYKLHSYHFANHSSYFSDLLSDPSPPGKARLHGASDEYGLQLKGVTSIEFDCLVWLFYESPIAGIDDLNVHFWHTILKLATMWGFDVLRSRSIQEIERYALPTAQKIEWGRELRVDKWELEAYTDLCLRAEPLTLAEGKLLGLDRVIRLVQVREEARAGGREHVHRLLGDAFGLASPNSSLTASA